jgi:hypothetical protein
MPTVGISGSRSVLWSSLAYLGLSIALTWPLVPSLGSRVPMGDHDLWQNYWNAWWWERALSRGESPFRTDLIFHPTGASLGWHTHSPANVLAMLPVAKAAEAVGLDGPAAAVSAATFAGFFLAALGAFLLAREVVGRSGPAFLAGIAFAFLPQHVEQSLEHVNLASYWAMPFAVLYLLRAAAGSGPRAWIPAGLFLGLNALLTWHNAVLVLLIAAAVAAAGISRAPKKAAGVAGTALAGILAIAMMLPFLWPMLGELAGGGGGFKDPVHKPIDPLFLIIPSPGHPLWGKLVAGIHDRFRTYPSMGFLAYIGVSVISLWAAASLWRVRPAKSDERTPGAAPIASGRRTFVFWSVLAVFHIVLAFGRHLQIAGMQFDGKEQPLIPLPFALLDAIPVLNTVRVANRFMVPAMLCLSVIAAMGGAALTRAFHGPRSSRAVLAGIGAAIVLDFLWVPFPLREIPRPAYLDVLADLPRGLAILDIPTGNGPRAASDMLSQTRHVRPIAGGYVSKEPPGIRETLKAHPVLLQVFLAHPPPPPPGESLVDAIRAIRVGLVVVHLDRTFGRIERERGEAARDRPDDLYYLRLFNMEKGIFEGNLDRIRAELREAFGDPSYADGDTEIYLVK